MSRRPKVIKRDLPVFFVDDLMIASRYDNICFISLQTSLFERLEEQARIMVPVYRLKEMVRTICRNLDFYPVPETKDGKKD